MAVESTIWLLCLLLSLCCAPSKQGKTRSSLLNTPVVCLCRVQPGYMCVLDRFCGIPPTPSLVSPQQLVGFVQKWGMLCTLRATRRYRPVSCSVVVFTFCTHPPPSPLFLVSHTTLAFPSACTVVSLPGQRCLIPQQSYSGCRFPPPTGKVDHGGSEEPSTLDRTGREVLDLDTTAGGGLVP